MAAGSKSRRDALRLSDESTLKFISLYEGEPILWNPFLDLYRNRDARAEAAARVARAMKIKGFGPEQVISKFKNLRSSYCQELKKIAASESSGAARDNVYVPGVKWFSKMDSFLKPHVTSRPSVTNYFHGSDQFINSVTECEGSENSGSCEDNNLYKITSNNDTDYMKLDLVTIKDEPRIDTDSSYYKKFKSGEPSLLDRECLSPNSTRHEVNNRRQEMESHRDDTDETLSQFTKYLLSLIKSLPRSKAFLLQQKIIKLAIDANIDEHEND